MTSDIKIFGQGHAVRFDTKGYHVDIYELGHFIIRIRNRTHLLTANSAGIEEVEQYRFLLCLGFTESRGHVSYPCDLSHRFPPLFHIFLRLGLS